MEAQELLAIAREKNGQLAHAKAEYERYLALYSETEGAARVKQRLAALLAVGRQSAPTASATASGTQRQSTPWRIQTFFLSVLPARCESAERAGRDREPVRSVLRCERRRAAAR